MDRSRILDLLERWIGRAAPEEGKQWLREKREEIAGGAPRRVFYTSFSAVPRYVGKADLERVVAEGEAAERKAAALALHQSPDERAGQLLGEDPELRRAVTEGALTWGSLADERSGPST